MCLRVLECVLRVDMNAKKQQKRDTSTEITHHVLKCVCAIATIIIVLFSFCRLFTAVILLTSCIYSFEMGTLMRLY